MTVFWASMFDHVCLQVPVLIICSTNSCIHHSWFIIVSDANKLVFIWVSEFGGCLTILPFQFQSQTGNILPPLHLMCPRFPPPTVSLSLSPHQHPFQSLYIPPDSRFIRYYKTSLKGVDHTKQPDTRRCFYSTSWTSRDSRWRLIPTCLSPSRSCTRQTWAIVSPTWVVVVCLVQDLQDRRTQTCLWDLSHKQVYVLRVRQFTGHDICVTRGWEVNQGEYQDEVQRETGIVTGDSDRRKEEDVVVFQKRGVVKKRTISLFARTSI